MVVRSHDPLPTLYETDETAWLDAMAELVRTRNWDEIDAPNLEEFLTDMARRDRRQVESRLATLVAHLLKWQFQPENRTSSWRVKVETQRQKLVRLLRSGSLHRHAVESLTEAYADGVRLAVAETGMQADAFPAECPWTVEQLVREDITPQ